MFVINLINYFKYKMNFFNKLVGKKTDEVQLTQTHTRSRKYVSVKEDQSPSKFKSGFDTVELSAREIFVLSSRDNCQDPTIDLENQK